MIRIKNTLFIVSLSLLVLGCSKKEDSSVNPENWTKRTIQLPKQDSLEYGKSYLSVYSQIYSITEHRTHNLTSMISMRNTSESDSIFILRAEYYDTHGKSVRNYFDNPIFLLPMETVEIILNQVDVSGGTGSNFIFEWKTPKNCPEPLFEGVMISTMGQQGLSFTTTAKRIK